MGCTNAPVGSTPNEDGVVSTREKPYPCSVRGQGEPGAAPLHPEELGYDEDPDVDEEDVEFVKANKTLLGSSFLSKTDIRHDSRCSTTLIYVVECV